MMNMKKSTLFAIIILVNGLFFALGMISATWFYNRSNKNEQVTLDSPIVVEENISDAEDYLSETDLNDLEDLYLPLFLIYNKSPEKNADYITNIVTSSFGIEKMDNKNYEEYKEDEGAILYSKESLDTVYDELFGKDGEEVILNSIESDEDDIYVTRANDSSAENYKISISDYYIDNNDNIVLNINYCKYYEDDLSSYIENNNTYNNSSNASDTNEVDLVVSSESSNKPSEEDLLNSLSEEFFKEQEVSSCIITVKLNNDYKYAKYQLVSVID